MENIRETVGKNLAKLRKQQGLTQFELAEKFNYSDRAISKWENGDNLPDIEVLYKLAAFYGVTVDFLCQDHEADEYTSNMNPTVLRNRIITACLIGSIIWMIATIVFVYMLITQNIVCWMAFVWAVPVSAIFVSYINYKWFKVRILYFISYSLFVWTTLAAIYLQCLSYNVWPLFLIGIPAQLSLLIWLGVIPEVKAANKKNK